MDFDTHLMIDRKDCDKVTQSKNDILLTAINGIETENYKVAIEKIMMQLTVNDKQIAYQKALEVRSEARKLVTVEDINIKNYKAKYGYYKKYSVIQLALDYVQLPPSFFKEKYHFSYIPKDYVISEVTELIESIKLKKALFSTYGGLETTVKSFVTMYA